MWNGWMNLTRNCLFVCLLNAEGGSKRQQEWQPKEAAAEEEEEESGAVPTESSPKTDEADVKPSGTSKYFIPKKQQTKPSFWRLLLRVTIIFVLLAAFIVSAISEFFKFYCE